MITDRLYRTRYTVVVEDNLGRGYVHKQLLGCGRAMDARSRLAVRAGAGYFNASGMSTYLQ